MTAVAHITLTTAAENVKWVKACNADDHKVIRCHATRPDGVPVGVGKYVPGKNVEEDDAKAEVDVREHIGMAKRDNKCSHSPQ
jgi:hypothetical protein